MLVPDDKRQGDVQHQGDKAQGGRQSLIVR